MLKPPRRGAVGDRSPLSFQDELSHFSGSKSASDVEREERGSKRPEGAGPATIPEGRAQQPQCS